MRATVFSETSGGYIPEKQRHVRDDAAEDPRVAQSLGMKVCKRSEQTEAK
jgi:hypothetical protein